MNITNILFDLDGTLTDPKEGITRCIQFSLAQHGDQRACPLLNYLQFNSGMIVLEATQKRSQHGGCRLRR